MTREEAVRVIKEFISGTCLHLIDQEALETLIPELTESEDERIRKELLKFLQSITFILDENGTVEKVFYADTDIQKIKKWIAWLEKQKGKMTAEEFESSELFQLKLKTKYANGYQDGLAQKEQKPLSTEETELNSLAFLEQMGYTCIPPKKEHQNNSDAPKNALGGALNSPLDKDKNLDDIAQDYVEAVKEYNPEPTWNLMQTAVCYGYHYREEEEQKPVEPPGKLSREEYLYQLLIDQLITYSDYEYLTGKKPAEWSKEDEKIRSNILNVLTPNLVYTMGSGTRTGTSTYKYDKEIAWLKSLPLNLKKKNEDVAKLCSNEWSEEDEKTVNNIISVLGQYIDYKAVSGTGSGYATPRYAKEIDWLKSIRPSWKPSEEQMEALNALNCYGGLSYVGQQNQLISLYNDLKKLI